MQIKSAKIITASNGCIIQDEKGSSIYPTKDTIASNISQQVKKAILESSGETIIDIFIGVKVRKPRTKKNTAPEATAPEVEAQKDTMPKSAAPKDTAPKNSAPKGKGL